MSTIWFVLLATTCAALVVVLRRASNGFGRLPEGTAARAYWLGFFALKSGLLLAAAALTAWCLVHWISNWVVGSSYPLVDEYSIWLFLPLAIVALSWSVRDQQARCRTCLRRLELPVEIGRPGSVLLNWAGTEMVCSEGHGVLYLPDSPANSLDRDRWNKLDESWESLFREE
jgi:Zn-dependent protease with chaperone function